MIYDPSARNHMTSMELAFARAAQKKQQEQRMLEAQRLQQIRAEDAELHATFLKSVAARNAKFQEEE